MNDTVQNQPAAQNQSQGAKISQMLQANFQGGAQAKTTPVPQDQPVTQNQPAQPSQMVIDIQEDATENLGTFEEVLDEIQNTVPHGVVQAVDQATDTLNPQRAARSSKERVEPTASPDSSSIDLGGAVQTVEEEKNLEIPVEVESFLQRVEDHHETAPTEVVIADGTAEVPTNTYPSRPVVVLPITQAEEQEGVKKSPKFSFRWLVEFSHKIVKMFTGKVIYRQES